jgi:phosphoglycolate phosphatase
MSLRAVIFDFDFTLVDSSLGFVECHDHACRVLALPPMPAHASMAFMGTPLREAFLDFFDAEHHRFADDYVRLWQARADEVMSDLTEVYPDAAPVLAALRDQGLRLGVVSQKLRHRIEAVLERERMAASFEIVVGGGDISAFKPAPEGILKACEALAVGPEQAIYVGDTIVDAQAAANAGVGFVAVLSGVTPAEAFGPFPHIAVLDGIAGLPELCRSLSLSSTRRR